MLLTHIPAVTALIFGTTAFAQIAQQCSSDNSLCFSLNIPETTASSGNGSVYMQITAPTTYTWVGLGQGTQMQGAQMFVLYTDASGSNVTLSPRLGKGEIQPLYNSAAEISILDGTGVSNGVMTVNFRCDSCTSWSGGSMDFTDDTGNFIYAYKSGDSLDSDSTSATITMHDVHDTFSFDFTNAKGGSSADPFTAANTTSSGTSGSVSSSCTATMTETSALASPSGTGCPTAWPSSYSSAWPTTIPSQYASCFSAYGGSWPTSAPYIKVKRADTSTCTTGSSGSAGLGSLSGDGVPFGGDLEKAKMVMIAHGVLAAIAWVILFPVGAISMRLLSFSGLVWFHAAFQVLAYLVYVAAFGLGIYLAQNTYGFNRAHPIIGILLFVLVSFQPIAGFLHHRIFKKTGGRSIWSHGHIWLGRILITVAIINGGLGLQLGKSATKGEIIAYGVVAGVVWLVYVASIVVGERRRSMSRSRGYGKEMSGSSSPTRY